MGGHINNDNIALYYISVFFETVFSISIIMRFLTDFIPPGETLPVRDFEKIYTRYLQEGFLFDFIPWIPINFVLGAKRQE